MSISENLIQRLEDFNKIIESLKTAENYTAVSNINDDLFVVVRDIMNTMNLLPNDMYSAVSEARERLRQEEQARIDEVISRVDAGVTEKIKNETETEEKAEEGNKERKKSKTKKEEKLETKTPTEETPEEIKA